MITIERYAYLYGMASGGLLNGIRKIDEALKDLEAIDDSVPEIAAACDAMTEFLTEIRDELRLPLELSKTVPAVSMAKEGA